MLIGSLTSPSMVEAVQISGEVEIAAWGRFRIPHGGVWRNRLHLTLEESIDVTQLRVEGRVEAREGDAVSADLREATLRSKAGDFRWVGGRQVIHWGSGLLFKPTSVVNPLQYVDGEPEWKPVDALSVQWSRTSEWEGTIVWVPTFVPATTTLPDGSTVQRPPRVFDYSQWTARADWRREPYHVGLVAFRGLEHKPARVAPGRNPFRLGTTVGAEIKTSLGERGLWVEGTYSMFDESSDRKTEFVVGVDRTSENGVYRAFQWHNARDDTAGRQQQQNHLMFVLEKGFADVHRLIASAIFDLETRAFRLAPTVQFALSDATTAALTVAYVEDSRGPLSVPLSNNEIRFQFSTRF